MLRPHTLFWVFDQAKNRTLAALSTFCEFLKIKTSLELLILIFENNLPTAFFG